MKVVVEDIIQLDSNLNEKDKSILQDVTDYTKQLFYFHLILTEPTKTTSKFSDEDIENTLKIFRVARSTAHRRLRRQTKGVNSKAMIENLKRNKVAVEEADDSALRLKFLLEEYKKSLEDR